MKRIRIIIDDVALKGFDRADGRAVVDALQSELRRVMANPTTAGEWTGWQRIPVLRLGPIPIAPGSAGSRRLGRSVASAISKGLKQ